jgi:calcium-dependent protein kinase
MIDLIMRADYNFDAPVWENISKGAKDFVSSLLVIDPKVRLNVTSALEHSWIVNREKLSHEIPPEDILNAVGDCLLAYKDTSYLKKIALAVIAHRSSSDEIMHLRKAFDAYDTERNGVISYEEFKAALEKSNFSEDGHILYTEFLAATMEAHGHIEERRIAEAFDRIDIDDSGYIAKNDLKQILGKDDSSDVFEEIVASADTGRDGKISYPEFLALFRKQTRAMAVEVGAVVDDPTEDDPTVHDLVGLDAKIPGGLYDPGLSGDEKEQANAMKEISD